MKKSYKNLDGGIPGSIWNMDKTLNELREYGEDGQDIEKNGQDIEWVDSDGW